MTSVHDLLMYAFNQHRAGNLQLAEQVYHQILQVQPHFDALHLLGLVYQQTDRLVEAEAYLRQALQLNPDSPEAHSNLSVALRRLKRLDESADACRRALQLRPDFADASNNLGVVLQEQGQWEEAAQHYRHALRAAPNHLDANVNLAIVLAKQGRLGEAESSYRQVLRLKPNHFEALTGLGNALRRQGRCQEAAPVLREAVRLRPASADAHMNLAIALLLSGDLRAGWEEYEWRLQGDGFLPRSFSQPAWDGSPLAGKTILLHAEQGLGDSLQFIRYAPLLKERGSRVIMECHEPLLALLRRAPGVDEVVAQGVAFPPFDVHLPLLSLSRVLGTTLVNIPARVPYLTADPTRVEGWRRELSAEPGFKVGIVWQGNPRHKEDRWRSVPLPQFEPLARIPGVRLVSLQRGPGAEQLPALRGSMEVLLPGGSDPPLPPFADTAALVSALDLVVGVDTAIVHLAGALGRPVWVALPFAPDWRWQLGRDDSPWYPTMRLFRQRAWGAWEEVFERLAAVLQERVNPRDTEAQGREKGE